MLPEGIRRLFRLARDVERDVDAEIEFHLEARARALVASGMDAGAARDEALRQFGDVRAARADLIRIGRGEAAQRNRLRWRGDWLHDARHAARGLARTPGVTAAVVLMLGLGIGGASAMYQVLDRLLLSVGPHITDPAGLRRLFVYELDDYHAHARVFDQYFSFPQLQAIARALPADRAMAMWVDESDRLGGPSGPRRPIALVSGNAFQVLGTRAALGRMLMPADDDAAAPPAAVISHALWRSDFGGEPDAVGRTLRLGALRYTIVGVAPAGFSGLQPGRIDAWVPIAVGAETHVGPGWQQRMHGFEAVVRVRAPTDSAVLSLAAQRAYRELGADRRSTASDTAVTASLVSVLPYRRPGGIGETTRLSMIVSGVAVMLCLIAVANVTNLLLLRAINRRRETAVRLALGSGRWRLVRSVVLESMLLALAGAVAAWLVAGWGGDLLRALVVKRAWQPAGVDTRVLLFTAALGLLVGLLTGLVPGLQASGADAVAALKAGARAGSRRGRLRPVLLSMQAAFTIVLLAGLGLYTRSFLKARAVEYGVVADRLINVNVNARDDDTLTTPAQLAAISAELAERVRALPGVTGVSLTTGTPIYSYGAAYLRAEAVDSIAIDNSGPFIVETDSAFLGVTGLRLLRGRAFTGADVATRASVAMVNEALARAFWPGGEALGKCLYVGFKSDSGSAQCRQVVGVVSSYRNQLQETATMKNYYLPLSYRWGRLRGSNMLVVRTSGPAEPMVTPILAALRDRLPESEPEAVRAIGGIVRRELEPWRSGTTLFGLFAGLAMLLAMGGLYSVVAYSVAQRQHEFGIRIAVGARGPDLVRLVLTSAFRPVAAGSLAGLALTLWLVKFVGPLLYETAPRDPVTLAAATVLLLLAAAVACVLPARSAARTDPRIALQAE